MKEFLKGRKRCIDLNDLNPLLFGLIARKRYTCHSDDSDEDSDQEESDDGDGKKEISSILYLILFNNLNIFHNTSIFNSIHLL